MSKRIGIIGGGIVGLFSAYYLRKQGFNVTIIEQGDLTDGCSFGNAGMIVPSHFIPLAAPGMISKGIRWMFNSTSPFYIKPRLNGDLLKWVYHFYRHATHEHVERSMPALKEISLFSKAQYHQLAVELPFHFGYHERGLLMLYRTKESEHEERLTVAAARKQDIEAHILSLAEIQKMEPEVKVQALGGVYFPADAHISPSLLLPQLIALLKREGVAILDRTRVLDFEMAGTLLQGVITEKERLSFDEIVIATGSWSGLLSKKLKIAMPMQAGKGYSFTLQNVKKHIRIPSIFLEARVAVTPMENNLRFGGTMEIAGVNHAINMNRVKGIVNAIPLYYPEMKVGMPSVESVWHGLRPCSPDGLPFIGRSKKIKNVIIATGHSMMGLSLGPGTGKLVAQLITKEQSSVALGPFDPERYE